MKSRIFTKQNIFLLCILFVSFIYRVFGLWQNHPFWVDEFSTADQARLLMNNGLSLIRNSHIYFEHHNLTTYGLVAISFSLLGMTEFTARLPFVILGSIVPIGIWMLAKKAYEEQTALIASVLATFSYFLITWSRQARGYVSLELFILASFYLYLKITKDKPSTKLLIFFVLSIMGGLLTHSMYLIALLAMLIHMLVFHFKIFRKLFTNLWFNIIIVSSILMLAYIGYISKTIVITLSNISSVNNVWYYHSFLWREYNLITFLAMIGIGLGYFVHRKETILFGLYILQHIIFLSFIFPAYTSRYLLPIFPLLYILMSHTIVISSSLFLNKYFPKGQKYLSYLIPLVIVAGIIINGDKFVIKPKSYYSVNHDFREIALVDYDQIYEIINKKGSFKNNETAVIETWNARAYWYLPRDYKGIYLFRWSNDSASTNGLPHKTDFIVNSEGEKVIPQQKNLILISNLEDLKKTLKKYPKGFIFIDDATLPKDVIEYAQKNFKKEVYLDHYALDDNPYSIWPATLYSWGIK